MTPCRRRFPWLFAAGDAVTGPATVIEAVAGGHRAAAAMHAFVCGRDMADFKNQTIAPHFSETPQHKPISEKIIAMARSRQPHLGPDIRQTNFDEEAWASL
ncbi:MAG: hypothetical protein R2861_10655 [Desulfobacterales bacterium]